MKPALENYVESRSRIVKDPFRKQMPETFFWGAVQRELLYQLESEQLGMWLWWEMEDSYETSA